MSNDKLDANERGKIERLDEKLYSRTQYEAPEDSREAISPTEGDTIPPDWKTEDIDTLLMADRRSQEQYPLMKKIFMVALLFFICAAAAAALIYFKGDNFISTKNLDIKIEGPVSISAGSPVDLEVTITNKNNAPLDKVSFVVIYPEGTRNAEDTTKPLASVTETLEALGAGEKVSKSERAVFLGSEGETKTVRVSVTYRVEGSNATFTKDKVFELTIGSAPVTVTIIRPETVTSGEPFAATISVAANSEEVLRNVILRAEYPYGWTLSGSSPVSTSPSKNQWLLGDLSPGDKKTVELRGVLLGEDNEERTFRFFVGVGEEGDTSFETTLSANAMVIALKRPAIDLRVELNGDSNAEYPAQAGKQVQATITVMNNLPENLLSPQIEARLSGSALDRQTIMPVYGGFYNSAQSTIFWNQSNNEDLGTMAPGESRTVAVNFSSLGNLPQGSVNQKMDLEIAFSGRPQNSGSSIRVTEKRTVKITSEASLTSRSLYSIGPLKNTGPIPPQAEKSTTYTIALALGNTQNDITDAKVSGVLGANVSWLGSEDENIDYNDATRTVTWSVGTLPSGAGFSSRSVEAFFRVAITPSLGQVGGVPVLLGNIAFTGTDAFASTPVRLTNPAVTTRISSDPRYVQGDETVVK